MKYRKKPVVIDATQFVGDNAEEVIAWRDSFGVPQDRLWVSTNDGALAFLTIPTLEGDHRADPGDWIIRGIKGEFYPCKPDIFYATYDPV